MCWDGNKNILSNHNKGFDGVQLCSIFVPGSKQAAGKIYLAGKINISAFQLQQSLGYRSGDFR